MGIQWRQAVQLDVGRLARFADRKGDEWAYGMLSDFDAVETVFSCVQYENDPEELFLICEVQDVSH